MQPLSLAKSVAKRTVFREGSIRRVLWGPCRGMRYRIFPEYGWSYMYGGWERNLVGIMRQRVQPGSTVYDLGANYGMHTLLFARLVGLSGRVYAFEPHPEVFAALQEQLTLNGLQTVVPICQAVSESTGLGFFDQTDRRSNGHLTVSTSSALRVQTTTLDEFVYRHQAKPPDFIKIDIEGSAGAALRGALRLLREHRPTVVVELHDPFEDTAVGTLLASLEYMAFRVTGNGLQRVQEMQSGWPTLTGMWGTVLALPPGSGQQCK
jgi:FkbM family methyltransferase